jgi:hypothetical protein
MCACACVCAEQHEHETVLNKSMKQRLFCITHAIEQVNKGFLAHVHVRTSLTYIQVGREELFSRRSCMHQYVSVCRCVVASLFQRIATKPFRTFAVVMQRNGVMSLCL